jgi:hypothetical protein
MPRGKRAERQPETPETPELEADEAQQIQAGQPDQGGFRNSDLTDDERLALLHHHKRKYQAEDSVIAEADAVKKSAKKAQKLVCGLALKECGVEAVDEIKDLIKAETPEGEAELKAQTARHVRVLQWTGAVPGTQFSFEDIPAVDHYSEGKLAGIRGDVAKPPHDPGAQAYESWMEGYHDGQGVLASAFEKIRSLDPEPESDGVGEDGADQIDVEESIAAAGDMPAAPQPPLDTSDRPFGLPEEAGGDGGDPFMAEKPDYKRTEAV